MPKSHVIKVGNIVRKISGDYTFEGIVVAVFNKYSFDEGVFLGPERIVVQNEDNILHIFNPKQLEKL